MVERKVEEKIWVLKTCLLQNIQKIQMQKRPDLQIGQGVFAFEFLF